MYLTWNVSRHSDTAREVSPLLMHRVRIGVRGRVRVGVRVRIGVWVWVWVWVKVRNIIKYHV